MTTDDAVSWAGGTQVLLASKLGLKQPSVASWGDYPPPLRQIQIEMLSGGVLKSEPGIFQTKASSVPAVKETM